MLSYVPNFIATDFIIIGCGGTGSRLVPMVAQFLATIRNLPVKRLILVDFDKVEVKNLSRQNFISRDVDEFKSEVLASRYAKHFGIDIISVPERFSKEALEKLKVCNSVVFCCVDSMAARRDIILQLRSYIAAASPNANNPFQTFFIDAGNEDTFGQVKIHTLNQWLESTDDYKSIKGVRYFGAGRINDSVKGFDDLEKEIPRIIMNPPSPIHSIPIDFRFYNELDVPNTRSCADLDQTMAINALMATSMFGFFQDFIYRNPITTWSINISTQGGSRMAMGWRSLYEVASSNPDKDVFKISHYSDLPSFLVYAIRNRVVGLFGSIAEVIDNNPVSQPREPAWHIDEPVTTGPVPATVRVEVSPSIQTTTRADSVDWQTAATVLNAYSSDASSATSIMTAEAIASALALARPIGSTGSA